MANPTTFGQPTIPITINMPANQLPTVGAQATQPTPQPSAAAAPAPVAAAPEQPKPKKEKTPAARYYLFSWKG